ncbi:MAG TPA: CHASE2 domain-containing protein [Nostocaceae cyanobacterium]|nr:CHASE2 domain-containing protein [Nostocaceae cyanobacterium]
MQNHNSRFRNLCQTLLDFGGKVVITSLVISGAIIGLRQAGALEGLELGAYDQLMRSRPDEKPDERFLIVGITEEDIQKRKEYPIHDGTFADLLTKLEEQQPRAIGLDSLRDFPQGPPQGRIKLERVISQSDRIIGICKNSSSYSPGVRPVPGISDQRVAIANLSIDVGGISRRSVLSSVPQKYQDENQPPEQHKCNNTHPENQVLSLSLQVALLYLQQEQPPIALEKTEDGHLKLGKTILQRLNPTSGEYQTKTDTSDDQILLNYRSGNNVFKTVTVSDVLENKIPPEDIKGKVILIGHTSPQAKDDFYTPYSASAKDNQKMPGVVIHAHSASQIISAVLDQRPLFWFWADWQEQLWIFSWALTGAALAWGIRNPWLFLVGFSSGLIILMGSSYWIFIQAGWIPLVTPLLGFMLSITIASFMNRSITEIYFVNEDVT